MHHLIRVLHNVGFPTFLAQGIELIAIILYEVGYTLEKASVISRLSGLGREFLARLCSHNMNNGILLVD